MKKSMLIIELLNYVPIPTVPDLSVTQIQSFVSTLYRMLYTEAELEMLLRHAKESASINQKQIIMVSAMHLLGQLSALNAEDASKMIDEVAAHDEAKEELIGVIKQAMEQHGVTIEVTIQKDN